MGAVDSVSEGNVFAQSLFRHCSMVEEELKRIRPWIVRKFRQYLLISS